MKKPGLLKRIFSFGKKQTEEPIEAPEETIEVVESIEVVETAETAEIEVDADPIAEAIEEIETAEPTVEPAEEEAPEVLTPKATSVATPEIEIPVEAEIEVEAKPEVEIPAEVEVEIEAEEEPELETQIEAEEKPEPASGIIVKSNSESEEEPQEEEKSSWLQRMKQGLSRSSSALTENISSVFTKRKLDDETLQDLEDILIQADLGVETAMQITDALADQRMGKEVSDEEIRAVMAQEIEKVLEPVAKPLELDLDHKPHVVLVVGVNGSGKTTTIGKLSQKLYDGGFSTILAAGDTFRAAAIEQLHIWGERTNSPVVSKKIGADAAGLAFDAWQQAKDQGKDVLLMDTAGRLQNRTELMDELAKIVRVLKKQDESAPHTVLLTLDATTGQNALNQVEIFKEVAGVNGLIMTKLDGTARGGIMVAISAKHKLPVYFIGVGEGVDDLEPFNASDFAKAIADIN